MELKANETLVGRSPRSATETAAKPSSMPAERASEGEASPPFCRPGDTLCIVQTRPRLGAAVTWKLPWALLPYDVIAHE